MRHWMCLLLLFCFLFANGQMGERHYLTRAGSGPNIVVDLDNDGDMDFVAISNSNDLDLARLFWYENVDGAGNNWEKHEIEGIDPIVLFFRYFEAGDINGDGWQDLIFGGIYTLIHNGNSSNIGFTELYSNSGGARCLLGDLDNDGDVDLVRIGGDDLVFTSSLNVNQDGNFIETQLVYQLGDTINVLDLLLEDVDANGNLDIVMIKNRNNYNNDYTIEVYFGNGDGTFNTTPLTIGNGIVDFDPNHINLAVADFDLNGTIDIIESKESGTRIFSQGTTNGLWTILPIGSNLPGGRVATADLNNDNLSDIVITEYADPSLHYLINQGNGSFLENTIAFGFPFNYGFDKIYLNDFDNDGNRDIAISNSAYNQYGLDGLFMLKNDGTTAFDAENLIYVENKPEGIFFPTLLDLDGDLDNDLFVTSSTNGNIYWFENLNIAGQFSSPQEIISNDHLITTLLSDLDGDGDKDIIATTFEEEIVWYENLSLTGLQFAPKQLLQNNVHPGYLFVTDFDNDGDVDLGALHSNENDIYWYERTGINYYEPHQLPTNSNSLIPLGFTDVNHDGFIDLIYKTGNSSTTEFRYLQQAPGGASFTSVLLLSNAGSLRTVHFADLNNDSFEEIIAAFANGLYLFPGEFNGNVSHLISNDSYINRLKSIDLDNDGKVDLYTEEGWYKLLNYPTEFSTLFTLEDSPDEVGDITGNGIPDFIFHRGKDELMWAENQIPQGSFIEGRVTIDAIPNCQFDISEDTLGIYSWLLELEGTNDTYYYTSTNPNGYYSAFLPDSGDYLVNLQLPNNYWSTCFNDSLLTGLSPGSITNLDFYVPIEQECPLMQISISASNLRPCINGSYSIQFCNEGTIAAVDATVEVMLDSVLVFNTANYPFSETDSSYIFNIGDVAAGECGSIVISVTPDCGTAQVGDEVCTFAHITPDSLCAPLDSLWDGSNITVNGFCTNDSIYFELKNTGSGNMSEARQFRIEIVNEDIVLLIIVDTFDLVIDQTKSVVVASGSNVWRLEADQDEAHPFLNTSSTMVAECANINLPSNLFPIHSGELFSTQHCRTLTGSFDPNIKEVIPKGYGNQHFIDRSWELDYTIQFQNTGNDTAFTVVILDPISEALDLATLKIDGASHPFIWELNTERELVFTFSNILLPDSTTNEVESHGFVKYSLKPIQNIPFGTTIENKAAIYFDANDPIITNETSQTIRTPIFATSEHVNLCVGDVFMNVEINEDVLLVDSLLTADGLYLDFFHLHAFGNEVVTIDTIVQEGSYYNGILITQDTIVEELLQSLYGCDSMTITNISSQVVNIDELTAYYDLRVYPKPANDFIYLEWNSIVGKPKGYQLMDVSGRVLEQIEWSSDVASPFQINVKELLNGVYWWRIDFEEGSIYERIVKVE